MARKVNRRFVDEQHHDEEVQPYILQLMHEENSHSEAHVVESNELMNSARTNDEQNDEAGSSKTRKVRGPTLLWGNKSLSGNISRSNMSNDMLQRLEQEMKQLKERHDEEMTMMKQNQERLLSELSFMRQVMCKFIPTESSILHNLSGSLFGRVPSDANSGHEGAPQAPHMSS